jgi:hypothetical protein
MRPNIRHIVKLGGEAIFIIEIKSGFCIIDSPFSEGVQSLVDLERLQSGDPSLPQRYLPRATGFEAKLASLQMGIALKEYYSLITMVVIMGFGLLSQSQGRECRDGNPFCHLHMTPACGTSCAIKNSHSNRNDPASRTKYQPNSSP